MFTKNLSLIKKCNIETSYWILLLLWILNCEFKTSFVNLVFTLKISCYENQLLCLTGERYRGIFYRTFTELWISYPISIILIDKTIPQPSKFSASTYSIHYRPFLAKTVIQTDRLFRYDRVPCKAKFWKQSGPSNQPTLSRTPSFVL